jgi:subtilisin-like proprotein convertase family protein
MPIFSNSFTGSVSIPDNSPLGITNILTMTGVPTGAFISQIRVTLNIEHTFDADLDIFLIDPDGNQIALSRDNGGGGDNYTNTVFVDSASTSITLGNAPFTGSFNPEQALSTLYPGAINGNWSLRVFDDFSGNTGRLINWSIDLTFGEASRSIAPSAINESRSTVSASLDGRFSVSWNDNTTALGDVAARATTG